MTKSISSNTQLEVVTRNVTLTGITDLLFDRYPGDNNTKLAWHEKVYLIPGTSTLCFPVINIISFYTSHNTNSAPKRLRDKRKYKDICNACLSFMSISGPASSPAHIPICRKGVPIEVGTFDEQRDAKSGLYLIRHVARLDKGIPNPKERPCLPLPWEISFTMSIIPNSEIKEAEIRNLTKEGGLAIGLGTFRGVFGKFIVTTWD